MKIIEVNLQMSRFKVLRYFKMKFFKKYIDVLCPARSTLSNDALERKITASYFVQSMINTMYILFVLKHFSTEENRKSYL